MYYMMGYNLVLCKYCTGKFEAVIHVCQGNHQFFIKFFFYNQIMLHIQVLTYKCYHEHHIYSFLKRFYPGSRSRMNVLICLRFQT